MSVIPSNDGTIAAKTPGELSVRYKMQGISDKDIDEKQFRVLDESANELLKRVIYNLK